ncbi:MAG: ABC-F family ATP-binding cassette domain-containing protein [Myxococcaceae bacterium]|nr:ABC-F family ATP-binding cassette domain-containing protein [Myxococcaceae bacterium]MBH2006200.1 ABC-F family ATP-binding cassette domain-containing protein [Myxococcaceae bacterium]
MIKTHKISLFFGSRKLFEDVNLVFTDGNCYGIIGANGAGKSTLLKILAGEQEASSGTVEMSPNDTLSVLKQDHFQYEDNTVLDTVLMGHTKLFKLMKEKDALYAKPDFSDADGERAGELENQFAELGGYEAETDAATLLAGLGIMQDLLSTTMRDLKGLQKVKVLLAQALFGKPTNLLLDEPTNHLDDKSIRWLENYLLNYPNTVIVISHDRHFLNKICTHTVDVDYGKAKLYTGNYDFWEQSSQLALELRSSENKKREEKAKELEAFIARFSANASKSAQATSRRKMLEKLTIEDLPISGRKRPNILFQQKREAGDIILEVKDLCLTKNGQKLLDNISFSLKKGDKAIVVGDHELARTALFQALMGELPVDSGTIRWGSTVTPAYLPKDQNPYFEGLDSNLIDWLRQYSEDKSENFIRSFLGRMLFSGEETLKQCGVISGGERVRCLLARMMLLGPNVLLFDDPTNHLDLESITALNNAVKSFPGTVLFATHDQTFARTVSNRLLEMQGIQLMDHQVSYAEFYVD